MLWRHTTSSSPKDASCCLYLFLVSISTVLLFHVNKWDHDIWNFRVGFLPQHHDLQVYLDSSGLSCVPTHCSFLVCCWVVGSITPRLSVMECFCYNLGKYWSFPHLEIRDTVMNIVWFWQSPLCIWRDWRSMKYDKCLGRAPLSSICNERERWTSGSSSNTGVFWRFWS